MIEMPYRRCVVVLAALWWYVTSGRYVETDDAYIQAARTAISADISGRVLVIEVHDNERVVAGQVLYRLDPKAYQVAVDDAKAQLTKFAAPPGSKRSNGKPAGTPSAMGTVWGSAATGPGHVTGFVGLAGGQDLIVARDQPHLGLCHRVGRGQRIDEHMDAVIAGECGEAEIGNDEPLGRQRTVVVAGRTLGRCRHDVDARLQVAQRLINRKRRGDILVERGGGG